MEFLDEFDERLANEGPPGIFTLNFEGCLQFDLLRTRDISRQNPNAQTQEWCHCCLLYTSPSPRDLSTSRMPSSA